MARAFAHRRRGEPVKTFAPTRTRSAPRGISPHVPESPEAADRLGQRLVSLREHEADEATAVLRVAVEGTAGHDGDPQALNEMHREGPIVFEGKASEVRHHVIRSLRRTAIEPRVLEAPDEKVPFLLVHRGQIPVVGLGEAEGHGRSEEHTSELQSPIDISY